MKKLTLVIILSLALASCINWKTNNTKVKTSTWINEKEIIKIEEAKIIETQEFEAKEDEYMSWEEIEENSFTWN